MIDYDDILENLDFEEATRPKRSPIITRTGLPASSFEIDVAKNTIVTTLENLEDRKPPVTIHHSNVTIESTAFTIDKTQLGCDKVAVIVEQAKDIVVDTDDRATLGVSVALSARKLSSDISKARKAITAPHTAFQKKAISIEKLYTDQLAELEHRLLGMVDEYQESRKERLEEHGIIDTSLDSIKTDVGSGSTKSYYEYKVVDLDLVPREYLKLDKTAVNSAVKNGVRAIPGVDIYETKKRQCRLKNTKETNNV